MAVVKIFSGKPIVNGEATVTVGDPAAVQYRDNPPWDTRVPDTTGSIFAVVEDRYLYHGGPGGSGNWEH